MNFLKRLASFWLMVVIAGLGGYFLFYNLEYIVVSIPHSADIRVRAAVAYIFIFLAGCTLTVLFFGFDAFRKSMIIGARNREIKKLTKKLSKYETSILSDVTNEPEQNGDF